MRKSQNAYMVHCLSGVRKQKKKRFLFVISKRLTPAIPPNLWIKCSRWGKCAGCISDCTFVLAATVNRMYVQKR